MIFKAKEVGAYVRAKPVNGSKLTLISKGDSAEIIEFGNKFESDGYQWAKVKYKGVTGWSQLDTRKCYMIEM